MSIKKYRLAVLNSHPIQYFAPLYRRLSKEPEIDLTVYYCSRQGLERYRDSGFGANFKWDIPLLDGYRSKFLHNLRSCDQIARFFSLINPSIVKELKSTMPDALWVHGHSYITCLLAIGTAKFLGIPVFMRGETHLYLKRSLLKHVLRRPLMKMFYRFCNVCLPIGTKNKEFYRYHGVGEDRLFTIPYTVDNEFFMKATDLYRGNVNTLKAEFGIPFDKPVILFASKLIRRKRAIDLLVAYDRLRHKDLQAALLFVGSGEDEKILKDYVQAHQVPEVYFLGFRNQSELPKFYAISDFFVLPAENEPWGLIINEAMCAGLPVIASEEIGAVADLVKNGFNGFLFKAGDIDALGEHLITLVGNAKLRQQMGKNSRNVIADWDFEHCVKGVKEALMYLKVKIKSKS